MPPQVNRPEIRPTDQALVITSSGRARLAAWGFIVPWDKKPIINARSETLVDKITFRNQLENRCVIPASAYFEWRKVDLGKLKNRIFVDQMGIFSMAGLLNDDCFTVITCAASPAISHIHSRMPAILSAEAETAWINGDLNYGEVNKHVLPYASKTLISEEHSPPKPAQGTLAF